MKQTSFVGSASAVGGCPLAALPIGEGGCVRVLINTTPFILAPDALFIGTVMARCELCASAGARYRILREFKFSYKAEQEKLSGFMITTVLRVNRTRLRLTPDSTKSHSAKLPKAI